LVDPQLKVIRVYFVALDVFVWSNNRVIKWLASIGLGEYADNIKFSGIHGTLFVLDQDFNHSTLTMCLQVPTSNSQVDVVTMQLCWGETKV
jgi:hypothetical protein